MSTTAIVTRLRPNEAYRDHFHLELSFTDAEDVREAIARRATFRLVWN